MGLHEFTLEWGQTESIRGARSLARWLCKAILAVSFAPSKHTWVFVSIMLHYKRMGFDVTGAVQHALRSTGVSIVWPACIAMPSDIGAASRMRT